MTKDKIVLLLEKNKDEKGIAKFEKLKTGKQKTYGIGLSKLKTLAGKIKKNHLLAAELWKENIYDCKVIAILIDEPAKITRAQVDQMMKTKMSWVLSYVFCASLLKDVTFAKDMMTEWITSKDDLERRCGYLLLVEMAKKDRKHPDGFYLNYLNIIKEQIRKEENFVKDAMNSALLSMGMRNTILHERALLIAKAIGKVVVDYGDNSCKTIDVVQHLSSSRVMNAMDRMDRLNSLDIFDKSERTGTKVTTEPAKEK